MTNYITTYEQHLCPCGILTFNAIKWEYQN